MKLKAPDFSQAELLLTDIVIKKHGEEDCIVVHAMFPEYSPEMAKKNHWINIYEEYMIFADLEFARRYPNHDFSKNIKKFFNFTDDDILLVAQGKKKLTVIRTKENTTISIG